MDFEVNIERVKRLEPELSLPGGQSPVLSQPIYGANWIMDTLTGDMDSAHNPSARNGQPKKQKLKMDENPMLKWIKVLS